MCRYMMIYVYIYIYEYVYIYENTYIHKYHYDNTYIYVLLVLKQGILVTSYHFNFFIFQL